MTHKIVEGLILTLKVWKVTLFMFNMGKGNSVTLCLAFEEAMKQRKALRIGKNLYHKICTHKIDIELMSMTMMLRMTETKTKFREEFLSPNCLK